MTPTLPSQLHALFKCVKTQIILSAAKDLKQEKINYISEVYINYELRYILEF
jgi:hypothetical protein